MSELSKELGKPYSFADAGWKDSLPDKLHLLPLLQAPKDALNALYTPIHLWPDEWQNKAEVAFDEGKKGLKTSLKSLDGNKARISCSLSS